MKRIFGILIFAMLMLSSVCFAAGEKVGNIYSTDIKAYINGVPVNAYNIGGKTCVAVEEVTMGYAYNEGFRTLLVTSFAPKLLFEADASSAVGKVGEVVGSIYSTDIKTYFYDKEMTAYNIGGRTCVAIEDLGGDNGFSALGGRYIWNADDRTIRLESLYDNRQDLAEIQNEYKYGIKIVNGTAEFLPDIASPNWLVTDFSGLYKDYSERKEHVIPIYYENTVIGYNFYRQRKYFVYADDGSMPKIEEMSYSFNCFYKDKVEGIMREKGVPELRRTSVISSLIESLMADVVDRYDTDEYSFLYLLQPTNHGKNGVLLYVRDDGSYEFISDLLPKSDMYTRSFGGILIDGDNDRVIITMAGTEDNYFFDLKTGKLR